ncbi:uncharacterized protein TNCV_3271061 [Trichonephila clavipes]|nr:uncharacterized protein TNCV_3271061 [Trichonephila clavipes]
MHVTRIALMDRATTSRALSQELGSFARQQVFAQTVRRRLLTLSLKTLVYSSKMIASVASWGPHIGRVHSSSSNMMIWDAIGYTFGSSFVRIDGTCNNGFYISSEFPPSVLPFIRALRNPTFQQDNARAHVGSIVRPFLDTEKVWMFPWPARFPDLSPI